MNTIYIHTEYSTTLSLKERFAYYVQAAVNQGAFLNLSVLLDRFLKTTENELKIRQRRRFFAHVHLVSKDFGLRLFFGKGKRGQTVIVTSSRMSILGPSGTPNPSFVKKLRETLKNSMNGEILAYEALKSATKQSRATLERQMRHLKENAKKYGLIFFKTGRNLMVKLKINTHQKPAIHTNIKAKAFLRNTPQGVFRSKSSIRRKAFWLAKQLKNCFWDNTKVKFNPRMAFRYCEWALQEGFFEKNIREAFDEALVQRHKDATDMGLNIGCPTMKFELSSTVSMAKKLLQKDKRSAAERWEETKPKIEENHTRQIITFPDPSEWLKGYNP